MRTTENHEVRRVEGELGRVEMGKRNRSPLPCSRVQGRPQDQEWEPKASSTELSQRCKARIRLGTGNSSRLNLSDNTDKRIRRCCPRLGRWAPAKEYDRFLSFPFRPVGSNACTCSSPESLRWCRPKLPRFSSHGCVGMIEWRGWRSYSQGNTQPSIPLQPDVTTIATLSISSARQPQRNRQSHYILIGRIFNPIQFIRIKRQNWSFSSPAGC